MKLTIGKRITFGFATTILLTAVLGIFTYTRITVIDAKTQNLANDALPGAIYSGDMATMTQQNVALLLQHIVSDDDAKIKSIEERTQATKEKLDKDTCRLIFKECLKRGLIVMGYNPDIRINPPLIIDEATAEEGIGIMEEAFTHVADRSNL